MKLEATLTLERETKNTYRYQEELSGSGKPPIISKCGCAARSGPWARLLPGGFGSLWRPREKADLKLKGERWKKRGRV